MRIIPRLIKEWPKLAWVATFKDGAETVEVYHGPCVEANAEWCVEAVWAGEFSPGAFDQTDLVFGTGIRCRDDQSVFVSSGTLFDRLCYCQHKGSWYVSNSLPGLMAMAELVLVDEYEGYMRDVLSMTRGLGRYVRTIKAEPVDVQLMYYNNLVYGGSDLKEREKPDSAPEFADFQTYYDVLVETAKQLGANARASARTNRIALLSSISSGYDSTASSVIAREAGCKHTVTIEKSSSLWRGSDSGRPITERLGLTCKGYPRTAATSPLEKTV